MIHPNKLLNKLLKKLLNEVLNEALNKMLNETLNKMLSESLNEMLSESFQLLHTLPTQSFTTPIYPPLTLPAKAMNSHWICCSIADEGVKEDGTSLVHCLLLCLGRRHL